MAPLASSRLGWSVAMLNMVGSIAFAVSAIGAYVLPSTGDVASLELDNLGTFVGGLCFLLGAVLLIPDEQLATRSGQDFSAGQLDGT